MKKQMLATVMTIAMGAITAMPVAAAPAESAITWGGIIPGSIDGTDIALRAKDGGEVAPGIIIAQADGTFTTTNVDVRAFALKDDGTGNMVADTETVYPDAINWYYGSPSITHTGREGNAYEDITALKVILNGAAVDEFTPVNTTAGNPNMSVSLSYDAAPSGVVTAGDSLYATATLYAEADAGAPVSGF